MASRDGELVLRLSSLQSKLRKGLDRSLSAHGISLSEFLVLRHLSTSASGRLRRVDLADMVGLTASGITRLIRPMVKTGLVDRGESTRDARVSLVALTDAGARIARDAEETFDAFAEQLLEPLGEEGRVELARLVGRLL